MALDSTLRNLLRSYEGKKIEMSNFKSDLTDVPIEYLLHDLHSALTASRHAVWTLKHRRGKHDEIMIEDLGAHIDHALHLLSAAREFKRNEKKST